MYSYKYTDRKLKSSVIYGRVNFIIDKLYALKQNSLPKCGTKPDSQGHITILRRLVSISQTLRNMSVKFVHIASTLDIFLYLTCIKFRTLLFAE